MRKAWIVLGTVLVASLGMAHAKPNAAREKPQDAPAAADEYKISQADIDKKNPVKPSSEGLAAARKTYAYDCAMCHGNNGDGKGEVAIDEKLKIGDFSDKETLKDKTDGDLFYVIKNGHGQMPPERIRSSPNELWNLVNYVRSLPNKKAQ